MSAESLSADLNHQLEQSAAIRAFAYATILGEHTGEYLRAEYIAFILFNRCLQTHEATEVVVRQSLVDDAWVLVRVLVEYAVNSAYMLQVADPQTADDFVDYPKYKRYEDIQNLKHTDEHLFRQMFSAEEEEEFRKQFDGVRLRFQDKRGDRWCVDDRLYKRAARVDEKISQARSEEHTSFKWLVNSVWRHAGSHVHGMADALASQASEIEGGVTVQRKYEAEEGALAVHSANLALYLVFLLVDLRLGGKNAAEIKLRLAKWSG